MRKKAKKRSKKSEPGTGDLSFKQKVKTYFANSPAVIAMKKMRNIISDKLLKQLLACFAFISPCWSFFFIGTPKKYDDTSLGYKNLLEQKFLVACQNLREVDKIFQASKV